MSPIEDSLNKVVQKHFPDMELVGAHPLEGGVSATVHRLSLASDSGNRDVVIRIHGETHSGMSAQLEYELLTALDNAKLPVAAPIAFSASTDLVGWPYVMVNFVEGSTEFVAEDAGLYIDKMAEALASIHAHPANELNLPSLPIRTNPIPEVFDYLPTGEDWRWLGEFLEELTHTEHRDDHVLLHGDFWPENVLWNNGELAAILDWEDAAIGDPVSDVACCGLELRYIFDTAGMQRFLNAYHALRPFDWHRLALWQIYVAAAAQKYMSNWGLPKSKEARMREHALKMINEAGQLLRDS